MSQDHYAVLGLPRTASQEDIKKAFRKLAAEHHPDKGGNETTFKAVNTAYQVLSDELKKGRYDAFGDENATRPKPPSPPKWPGAPNFRVTLEDLNSVFSQHFDPFGPFHGGGVSDFARKARPIPAVGDDVKVVVAVHMEEALAGIKKTVRFNRGDTRPCRKCATAGSAPGGTRTICPTCSGNGRVIDLVAGNPAVRQCRTCSGSGSVSINRCGECSGSGKEPVQREISVTIPKGLRDGQSMKVKGMGKNGTPPGDLLLSVEVRDSENWWARGETLFTTVELTIADMVKGGSTVLQIPDGRTVAVPVPPGGGCSKVRGAWKNPSGQDGDIAVLFKARSAQAVSPRAERLMKELLEELEGRARRL